MRRFAIANALRLAALALLIGAVLTPSSAASSGDAKREANEKLFSEQALRVFDIEIPQEGLIELRQVPVLEDGKVACVRVPAIVVDAVAVPEYIPGEISFR